MAALGFFNHNWSQVSSYFQSYRYVIDSADNVFIFFVDNHPHKERVETITVHSKEEATAFFVDLIHKGWKQQLTLDKRTIN